MPTILQNHHVLAVHNVRQSARFYVDVLGFQIVAEPPGWVFVKRDECLIMLGECPDDLPPRELGCHNYFAYFKVDDVDAFHADVQSQGGTILNDLANRSWGMREFGLETVDGHRIMIGQTIV